jgi:hypothetical protein
MIKPLSIFVLALAAAGEARAQVMPPPLPEGSERIQVEPGLQEAERQRAIRAHRSHGKAVRPLAPGSSPAPRR